MIFSYLVIGGGSEQLVGFKLLMIISFHLDDLTQEFKNIFFDIKKNSNRLKIPFWKKKQINDLINF